MPLRCTQELFTKFGTEARLVFEQFSGEGCSTIAPHDSMSRGRFRFAEAKSNTIENKGNGEESGIWYVERYVRRA